MDLLMTEPTFRSDMLVEAVTASGTDRTIAEAARVSTRTDGEDRPHVGLIHRLWRDRHTSTFEHCTLTVRVEVPIFVAREWMRHRTQAFNEVSGRYSVLEGAFYVPGESRPLVQVGKAMDYRREPGSPILRAVLDRLVKAAGGVTWRLYEYLLRKGVAREVARNVLPVSLYTSFYATASLLNWFRFLELRTDPTALWEIRDAAAQVEDIIAEQWPIAHGAFEVSQGGLIDE